MALKNKLKAVQEQSRMLTKRLTEQTKATATAIQIQELVVGLAARNGWRKVAVVVEDQDIGQLYSQVALPVGPVEVDFFGGEPLSVKDGHFDVVFLVLNEMERDKPSDFKESARCGSRIFKQRLEEALKIPVLTLDDGTFSPSAKSAA